MLCLVGGIRREWKRREENVIFHCVNVVKREDKENEVDEAFKNDPSYFFLPIWEENGS